MKTNVEARKVNTSTSESREFTIKANGKAFRILIDGLYENKIQSIVREIWANALDSHVAAGCDEKQFAVTFPSMFNPTFTVRDYGTSLSHEDIMVLYTTVFESTKEDTNDAVGKFGLGSKSPFAYTDTFSVSAVMDGQKRLYSALIAESGVPEIHFLGEIETDEPQGIEVSFPIETRDIDAFRKAALRVSHGFDVKPVVLKQTEDEPEFTGWPELELLSEGEGWKLLSGSIEGYGSRAYAKMGCVLYPINVDAIPELSHAERRLLQSTMVIDFPVGDLEINASREALSYGPKDPTAKSIRNRIRTIVDEMVSAFMEQYDEAETYWDACVVFNQHMISGNMPEAVKEHLKSHAKFEGKLLKTAISVGHRATADIRLPTRGLDVCALGGSKLGNVAYRFDYNADYATIPARKDVAIFIEDLESDAKVKRVPAKIKEAYRQNKYDHVVWIKYSGGKEAADSMLDFLAKMEGADVQDVGDLPEIVNLTGGAGATGIRRPVQVRTYTNARFDERADLSPEDFDKGGYYVPLERMKPQVPESCYQPGDVWAALRRADVVDATSVLYGAPKSLWKHFEGKQWINIYDLAKTAFAKNQPKKKVAKARMIERVLSDTNLRYLSNNLKVEDFAETSIARQAVEFYNEAATATKPAVEHVINLATVIGKKDIVEGWANADFPELDVLALEIKERYPMLEHFDNYYMRREVDMLTHYVQVCDKAAELDSLTPTTAAVAA